MFHDNSLMLTRRSNVPKAHAKTTNIPTTNTRAFAYLLDDLFRVHVAVLVELLLCDGRQDGLQGLLTQGRAGGDGRPRHERIGDGRHALKGRR